MPNYKYQISSLAWHICITYFYLYFIDLKVQYLRMFVLNTQQII